MNILLLIIGLALILVGANFLTDGSAALAKRFNVSEFVIGLTIVAVGTSTPELVISTLSAIGGKSDMAIGNVVGSNIFNVFVILGICALIRPVMLTSQNIRRDIPIGVIAALVLCIATSGGSITRLSGIVMLLLYTAAIIYSIRTSRKSLPDTTTAVDAKDEKRLSLWIVVVMIIGGLGGLIYGGELFLRSATALARNWGISESIISITLVAGGTSMPELASSVVSVAKGKSEMALGNVIGSNVANILLVLGTSATVRPLTMGGITTFDIIMVALASVALFIAAFTFRRRCIDRWEGVIFILIYVGYIWFLTR